MSLEQLFSSRSAISVFLSLLTVGYALWLFFIVYHLQRFGRGIWARVLNFVFVFGALVLLLSAIALYAKLDLKTVLGVWVDPSSWSINNS